MTPAALDNLWIDVMVATLMAWLVCESLALRIARRQAREARARAEKAAAAYDAMLDQRLEEPQAREAQLDRTP